MAYQLVAEVLDHAPPMTAAERLVLVAIAEAVRRPSARECDLDMATLVRRTGGLDPSNIRAALRRLADRGIEVRVPLSVDRAGRPVYAHRGRVPRYRLPEFPPPPGCLCGICINLGSSTVDIVVDEPVDGKTEGGRTHPPIDKTAGQEGGRIHPPTQEGGWRNTEGGRRTTEGGRRTTHSVVQRPPSPSVTGDRSHHQPTVAYLAGRLRDATDDEIRHLIETIKKRHQPQSISAYVRAIPTDDLAELLAEVRAERAAEPATLPPPCGDCDNRFIELPDGRIARCPTCHPLTRTAA